MPAAAPRPWSRRATSVRRRRPESKSGNWTSRYLIGKISSSPAGHQYLRVDNDILIVGLGSRNVAALVADLSRL